MTSELRLDVRLDGHDAPAGVLVRDANGALAFAYTPSHLAAADTLPLSLSLPLTDEPFADPVTRAFFDNLLQESSGALIEVMAREGLSRDDIAGLLLHLGRDCPGALSVLPAGAPPVKVPGELGSDYRQLSQQHLVAIVRALHEQRRLPAGTNDPSPLAGVQSKIALTRLPDGSFAEPLPGSGAPTTHILKVPDREHRRDAVYEAALLSLSQELGFPTAEAEVLDVDGIEILVVRRFDRIKDPHGRIMRLHQEDFAQALGLPAQLKYERRGTERRRFDVTAIRKVLDATSDPAGERDRFIRVTLFDLLTGNVDGHAKNFALLHLGRREIRVAPRYDLLPTRLDPRFTDELAYRIGSATRLPEITKADMEAFLAALGVASPAARRRVLARTAGDIATGLGAHLERLIAEGRKPLADLIASNLRDLLPELDVEVPQPARDGDAFVARGGGWLAS
jgi:serine/threonine-protein kinase HipA